MDLNIDNIAENLKATRKAQGGISEALKKLDLAQSAFN